MREKIEKAMNVVFTNEICIAGFSRQESAKEHRHELIQVFIFFEESGSVVVNEQKLDNMLEEQTVEAFYNFINEFFYQIGYEESSEPLYDERVEQTMMCIREKGRENITVSELSHWIGLSESRLSHLFKEQTGLNIKRYILLIKWKAAYLQMLSNKNITISAMEGGFASSSHFSATNTRFTGIPAKQMSSHSTIIKE